MSSEAFALQDGLLQSVALLSADVADDWCEPRIFSDQFLEKEVNMAVQQSYVWNALASIHTDNTVILQEGQRL